MKKIILTLTSLLSVMSLAMFAGCGEDPHEHAFGSELQHNDTHHYYVCECGEKKDETAHTFDKEVAEETYFKEEGAETVTFFKSCVCGVKGSDTFSVDKTEGVFESFIIVDKAYDGNACSLTFETNSNETATVEYKIKGADDSTYTTTAPVDAGEYTVRVSVAGNRVYSAVSQTKDFTISKCEISGLSQSFTYNGSSKQTVDIPTSIVPESGISLDLTFEDADVDANVIGVKVLKDGNETNNYEVKNCTATIVKKEIHIPSLLTKVYDGDKFGGFEYTFTTEDGIISGDTVTISFDAGEEDEVVNVGTYNDCFFSNTFATGMENYQLVESTCNVEITQKYLRFEDVYVKNYDGTKFVRFDFNDALKDGVAADEGVYVKIEALEYDTPENLPLVNAGYYAKADFGLAQFYTSDNLPTDNYAFDDNDFQGGWSGFKLWILDTNPLVIEVTDRFNIDGDYILNSNIRQGSVEVGDSIILPGTPDKVYEVLKIEKLHKEQGQATVGEEVGIYIDGMADLAEVSGGDLLYTQNNIPQLTTTFFASIYAKTEEEGGRHSPFFDGYKPNIVGLSASQQATINIIDVYGKEDTMVNPGDSALVKITLTNALPVSLLENLEFTMIDGGIVTVTGVGVDYVESSNHANSMVATDNFDTEAGIPMVIRLTNTRSETLDTLQFYVSNGSGSSGGSYLTDFTIKLYDSSFNLVEGTFNNTEGSFTKSDSSKWSLEAEETCYIVITTTNETADVFAWLS